jgi:hypothetical protein
VINQAEQIELIGHGSSCRRAACNMMKNPRFMIGM